MGKTPTGQTRERVLDFMRQRLLAGQPPTVREVQDAFGFRSVQSARGHLEALVAAGQLTKQSGKARGYRLADSDPPPASSLAPQPSPGVTRWIPLLGRVAAGGFQLAVEEREGLVPVYDAHPGADDALFALRVRGDSMRDAGILPGDILIVRRQTGADDGAIVVALVGDEATVKQLRLTAAGVELHPANPQYPILHPAPEDVRLLGRVIEVRRYLG